MSSSDLESVALALVAEGKGILAADETVPTLTKRFQTLGIQSPTRAGRGRHGQRAKYHESREETLANVLSDKEQELMDASWRAANYLSVGQIYLYDNPVLKQSPTKALVALRSTPRSKQCH